MMQNRVKKTLALTFLFFAVCSVPAFAGQLVCDNTGFRYINDDRSFKTGWHQEGENGPWYYFGDDGWYYRDPDQSYVIGWREFDGEWYYFDEVGYMKTELVEGGCGSFCLPCVRHSFDRNAAAAVMVAKSKGELK